jgi:beta-glucosidase
MTSQASAARSPASGVTTSGGRTALDCDVIGDDGTDLARAARLAAAADAAVVVVGYTSADEGEYIDMSKNPELFGLFPPLAPDDPIGPELADIIANDRPAPRGGDRETLTLHARDEELLLAVAAAQPRTVAVLVTGSAVVTERWRGAIPGIVVAWYAGMEGGHAIADVLLGRVNPSGRLPCAFPVDAADLVPFDRDAHHVEYGLWHGQQHLDRVGRPAAFPLGWGLSFTRFKYGAPTATVAGEHVDVEVDLSNVGSRDGAEVVQCYAEAPDSAVERAPRWLVGFAKVPVAAGATVRAKIRVPVDHLAYWDEGRDDFVVEAIRYDLVVAPDAAAPGQRTSVMLPAP